MSKKGNSNNIKINKKDLTLLIIVFIIVIGLVIFLFIYNKENFKNHSNNSNNNSNNDENNNFANLKFDNEKVNKKYNSLIKHIGSPTYVEMSANNVLNSATWMSPLSNYEAGLFNGKSIRSKDGLDYIKINGFVGRKHHPIAADMFVIAGKYLKVPEILIGPLKYASETINIEQLEVPRELNNNFGETQADGEKGKALVTGSCASVTISAITVKFVEDMIAMYNNGELENVDLMALHTLFRQEYDQAILNYLCEEKDASIDWFNAEDYNESNSISALDQCVDLNRENFSHKPS